MKFSVQVSVVIPCHNESKRIESNLRSLLAQSTRYQFEVVYVENNSSDNTWSVLQKFKKKYPDLVKIIKEKKPGAPAARNAGVRVASGSVIIFTDADCEFVPQWLDEMASPLLEERKDLLPIGYVSGQVISRLPKRRKMNQWEQYFDRLFFTTELERMDSNLLPWAPSCNLAFRKDIFEKIGGLDEIWTSAYDTDLSWRILLSGFASVYAWKAVAYHERRDSLQGLLKQWENYAAYNFSMFHEYRSFPLNPWQKQVKSREENFRELVPGMMAYTGLEEGLISMPMDVIIKGNVFRGALRALRKNIVPSRQFRNSRQGKVLAVKKMLPRAYRFLHDQGWCYWINPHQQPIGSSLLLKNLVTGKKLFLNATTWKVWFEAAQGMPAKAIVDQFELIHGKNPHITQDIKNTISWLKSENLLPGGMA